MKLLPFILVIAVVFGPSSLAAQRISTTQLTPVEMRLTAVDALQTGKATRALAIAEALLLRDSDDVVALRVAGQAALEIGQSTVASKHARRLFRLVNKPSEKFFASRLVALAETRQSKFTTAQFWLRRAHQFAPDAAATRSVTDDYRFLRNQNPWSMSFRFGASPTNNVNNGARTATTENGGALTLSAANVALAGYQASVGAGLRYRLHANASSATFANAKLDYQTYAFNGESEAILLEEDLQIEGSDYAFGTLSFGLNHRRIFVDGMDPTDFSVTASKSWFGGDPYRQSVLASISQGWKIGDTDRLQFAISREKQTRIDGDEPFDIHISSLTGKWLHGFENNDRLSIGLTARQTRSASAPSDYDTRRIRFDYDIAKPIAGVSIGAGVELEQRDYNVAFALRQFLRQDKSLNLNMSFTFDEFEFYGFKPRLDLSVRRTDSNDDLFDRDTRTIGLGFQSSF